MTMTLESARDAVQRGFLQAWNAATTTLLGQPARVFWQAVPQNDGERPEPDEAWARFAMRHATGSQRTLAPEGERRFTQRGVITVEVHAPLTLTQAEISQIASAALKSLQGKRFEEVWIRNAVAQEASVQKHWYLWLVTANFEYDEVA